MIRRRLTDLLSALRAQLARSPALALLGALGVALAVVCLLAAVLRGVVVPPEGNLYETATFDGAVGIFMLTLAVLAPGVEWSRTGRRIWAGTLVGLTLYSYGIETIQAFRGLDPRFSRVAGPLDQAAGGIFFLAALGIMACFIILAVKYFRAPDTFVNVAVRYGAVASLIAFGVGIWMSVVTDGRHVPEAGNLLFLHAAGFHGLQVVPVLALFFRWGRTAEPVARHRVHAAGLFWLGACLAIAWQSLSGRSVLELAPATGAAALLLLGWLGIAVTAVRAWLDTGPRTGLSAATSPGAARP